MEELIDVLLELSSLWRVLPSKQKRLFEFTANGGCLLVNLHLIPSLLQEVGAIIIASICITKRDVLDIVIWFGETISYHVRE